MLEPGDRTLLGQALEPPEGYRLDFAVGTTFSLDLLALLTAPLAFTLFDRRMEDDAVREQSLEVLESLRRYAKRMALFCQAGRIAWPRARYPQFAWLERTIIECRRSESGGVFHPKVWVLRYIDDAADVRYRALCLSRNLTLANSWDTLIALDGELTRGGRRAVNAEPLANFIGALPTFALRDLPATVAAHVATFAEELRRVEFAPPSGFTAVEFCPLGFGRYTQWPFTVGGGSVLVISPFLSAATLDRLSQGRSSNTLVSTAEALAALPERPKRFAGFWTLDDSAIAELPPDDTIERERDEFVQLSGLHAKTYVIERGQTADVWTGSANCTEGGFHANVEFLVRLTGLKDRCGIETMMKPDKEAERLVTVLKDASQIVARDGVDSVQRGLERRLEDARAWLSECRAVAHVIPAGEEFDAVLRATAAPRLPFPQDLLVRCWPVMVGEARAITVQSTGELARFDRLSLAGLSAFFAFHVLAQDGEVRCEARFVLNIPLDGAPTDREERLLRTLIGNRSRLIRFLTLLLCEDGVAPPTAADGILADDRAPSSVIGNGNGDGIFEMLVRALDRTPERLDDVASLMKDIESRRDGESLFPEGFETVWQPIWSARCQLKQDGAPR